MRLADATGSLLSNLGIANVRRCRGPLIVMYHGIGGGDGVPPGQLAQQLDALMARRRIVRLSEAISSLDDPDSANLACLTFDDGYCDFVELALPILEFRRVPATLFVPVGHVGGWNVWDAGVAERRPILTGKLLASLDSSLVDVGVHGSTHRRLIGLSASELRQETVNARRMLEELIGRPATLFAYPYGQRGDFDRPAEAAVRAAGFQGACTTCFGRGNRPTDRFRLRRVGVEPTDSLTVVERKLDGAYDWLAAKEKLAHNVRSLLRLKRHTSLTPGVTKPGARGPFE